MGFFKAGIIGDLEDMRDDKIAAILTSLQSYMRYRLAAITFNEAIKRRNFKNLRRTIKKLRKSLKKKKREEPNLKNNKLVFSNKRTNWLRKWKNKMRFLKKLNLNQMI